MKEFRVAKCLDNNGIHEYAIFADGSRKKLIQNDEQYGKYFEVDNELNTDCKTFMRFSFSERIKDAVDMIRKGNGDCIQSVKLFGRVDKVIYFLDRKVGDISTCARGHYSSFRKECLDNDFSECLLITEKEITDTGIFYIDYSSLAKKYNCVQYFIVLRFSEEKDCAFYMNGISTYNIKDAEAYEKWKNDNIDSFIAE